MEQKYSGDQFFSDINTRIRDIEEKQRILKDRVLLIGKSLIDEKEESLLDIKQIKKTTIKLEEENLRMREFIQRITEQLSTLARKEDLSLLERQFNLFRK